MSPLRDISERLRKSCDGSTDKEEAYRILAEWDEIFASPDNVSKMFYDKIRVSYTVDPKRMLRLYLPVKMMNLKRYRLMHRGVAEECHKEEHRERTEWRRLIDCALRKADDMGLMDDWQPIAKALIVFSVCELKHNDNEMDHLAIKAINSALKENGVIRDTDFNSMSYYVQVAFVSEDEYTRSGTHIAVLDIEDDEVSFQDLKLCDLAND